MLALKYTNVQLGRVLLKTNYYVRIDNIQRNSILLRIITYLRKYAFSLTKCPNTQTSKVFILSKYILKLYKTNFVSLKFSI